MHWPSKMAGFNSKGKFIIPLRYLSCQTFSTNGWLFWSFERRPGDWAILDTLRQ